jgi:hypothetical protein
VIYEKVAKTMHKKLLIGVAVVAMLAFGSPAFAQRVSVGSYSNASGGSSASANGRNSSGYAATSNSASNLSGVLAGSGHHVAGGIAVSNTIQNSVSVASTSGRRSSAGADGGSAAGGHARVRGHG